MGAFELFDPLSIMTTLLETFVINHPDVTLSDTDYRHHFHLGGGVNIVSSPAQRVHSFVENEGSSYRFLIVGQVASFRVVEDAVRLFIFFPQRTHDSLTQAGLQFGFYLSVNLGEPQSQSVFSEMFQRQQATLEKIEEEEGANEKVHVKVIFFFLFSIFYLFWFIICILSNMW
jgi:hypothetical protein